MPATTGTIDFGGGGAPAVGPPRGGGRWPLIAGIAAGILALGVLAGGALLLRGGDDGPPPSYEPERAEEAEVIGDTGDTGDTGDEVAGRVGTTVQGVDLQVGDCVDYEAGAGLRASYDLVDCDTPHLGEVTALLDHPDAAGGYPGVDALDRFAIGCDQATETWLGADPYATTLAVVPRVPDSTDWSAGMRRVACLVAAHDGTRLSGSTTGEAASYQRGVEVEVDRLKLGDCFQTAGATEDTGAFDLVEVVGCDDRHEGFFFGRSDLHSYGRSAPYPGDDAVSTAALAVCDEAFQMWFGADPSGVRYHYWSPSELTWGEGDRGVLCAVLDDAGLPAELVFDAFRPVSELAVGDCYLLPPDVAAADLGLDTSVEPVPCREEHQGQIFGIGELDAGTFPGDSAAGDEVDSLCIRHFTLFVGIGPAASTDGAYLFWAPTGEGWSTGDRRYRCTFLDDTPTTGSREELSA